MCFNFFLPKTGHGRWDFRSNRKNRLILFSRRLANVELGSALHLLGGHHSPPHACHNALAAQAHTRSPRAHTCTNMGDARTHRPASVLGPDQLGLCAHAPHPPMNAHTSCPLAHRAHARRPAGVLGHHHGRVQAVDQGGRGTAAQAQRRQGHLHAGAGREGVTPPPSLPPTRLSLARIVSWVAQSTVKPHCLFAVLFIWSRSY